MGKKRILAVGLMLATAAVLSGCGGSGSSTTVTGASGVEATGSLLATRSITRTAAGYGELNNNFKDAYLVPTAISVAVAKFELLKGADDTTPYVVFDTGADLTQAKVIDLMTDGANASFGENTEYPEPGTYTHVRMTLVYLDQVLPINIGDGNGTMYHHCRVYASTVGNIEDGDVLMDVNNELSWIEGAGFFPVSGDRPPAVNQDGSEIVQFANWAADDANSPDPLVNTIALPSGSEVVVPQHPSGKYKVNVSFDVTQSPQIAGSAGIFLYDDVDEDGQFEPAVNDDDGGDSTWGDPRGVNGWSPLPPTMTISFTKE